MIIYVNARFLTQPVSGVQRYGIECSIQIKKLCHEIYFLSPKNIIHHDIAKALDVKIIGNNTGHLWEQFDLPKYLNKQQAPPLLNFANTAPLLYSNNYVTIHDLAFYLHPEWNSKLFSLWYNILMPRIARNARHVFTVSNTIKEELIKYYKINYEKISVTYNGVSQKMLQIPATGAIKKEKVILSVGSFNTRKNHQVLINAFLKSNIKETYQLVIIGDKNKVFSETNISETELINNNIKIYNEFAEKDLIEMYQKAEVVASLSLYEGFGIPLLEGLYFNCKIICSDIPVYRELYADCATFCDPRHTDNVISALNNVPFTSSQSNSSLVHSLFEKYDYRRSAEVIVKELTFKK